MGPIIILDKSALQALAREEILFLMKHYSVNVPPILLIEILADLKKGGKEGLSPEQVQVLSKKLTTVDPYFNVHYKAACLGSLLGNEVPMTGQVLMAGGQTLRTEDGKPFLFFDDEPENEVLRRWEAGAFSDGEKLLADRWRSATRSLDLEGLKKKFRGIIQRPAALKTIEDLKSYVDAWVRTPDLQMAFIEDLLDELEPRQEFRDAVLARWLKAKMPTFEVFAPYAFYCFKVGALFRLGVLFDLLSTKATNRLDLEYLFYVPFSMVFCSGDKFHISLWPHVLREDQTFVERDVLKSDLKNIANHWSRLTDEERRQFSYDYGSYPPPNEDSATYRIWKKHMRPWTPGAGNRAGRMTPEEEKALLDHLRPFMEAIDKHTKEKDH